MPTRSELLETWIPDGGFRIERRKVKTADGSAIVAECLVPRWDTGELTPDQPRARQPCLQRIVADCLPECEPILDLAERYGLLTVSLARTPAPGKPVPSIALPPEPLDIWRAGIRELQACTDLWDRIAAGGSARRRGAGTETGRRSRQRPLPPDRPPGERLGLPAALPARHAPHRPLATARRRSGGTGSVRSLSRAGLWPLVPQRRLQKRPAVLLENPQGPRVSEQRKRNSGLIGIHSLIPARWMRCPTAEHLRRRRTDPLRISSERLDDHGRLETGPPVTNAETCVSAFPSCTSRSLRGKIGRCLVEALLRRAGREEHLTGIVD